MTEAELQERCHYWQSVLRLEDWRIKVRVVHAGEIEGSDGTVNTHAHSKHALVKVANRSTCGEGIIDGAFPGFHDSEHVLVHELIHVHFHGLLGDDPLDHEETDQEQAIEMLAAALLSLDRREP